MGKYNFARKNEKKLVIFVVDTQKIILESFIQRNIILV